MTKDAYTTAPDKEPAFDEQHPSIVLAVLMILGVTFVIAASLAAIEYLANVKIPGGMALSSVFPVAIAGYIYGRRKEIRFNRAFRLKVIAVWYLFSITVSIAIVSMIGLDLTFLTGELGAFGAIFVVVMLLSALVSYLLFGYGNTLGLKGLARQGRKIE